MKGRLATRGAIVSFSMICREHKHFGLREQSIVRLRLCGSIRTYRAEYPMLKSEFMTSHVAGPVFESIGRCLAPSRDLSYKEVRTLMKTG